MIKDWILASRPKTLPAAIVPVWVGGAPVLLGQSGQFSWLVFFSTLAGCLCIQIATNFFNDAIDARKGADTPDRLGPTRMAASGRISPTKMIVAALVVCAVGAVAAIPLILEHGWIPIAIGGVSYLLAYGYTGGPFPLAYRGFGELFVILFFGLVAVLGTYFMQTGEWFDKPGLIVALQVGLYSTVLIAINNLRDIEGDRKANKKTLAVRLGKQFARVEIGFLCFAPLFMWFFYGPSEPRTVGALATSFLLASFITFQVFVKEPGRSYNRLLGVGALQLINFAVWFSIWVWR